MKVVKPTCHICGHESPNLYWHELHMQSKYEDRK